MTRGRPSAALAGAFALLLGCQPKAEQPFELEKAQFGVFFGGDVQELTEIPLETESTQRTVGIRLVFRRAPEPPRKIHWELERPRKAAAAARKIDAGGDAGPDLPLDRLVQFGDVLTRPHERTLDVPLTFRPTDPLGDWSVRVSIDEQQVLNRPFKLVKPKPKRSRDNF